MQALSQKLDDVKASVRHTVAQKAKRNGTLFTAFASLIVVISGIGLVDGRKSWWISGLVLTALFVLVFLVLNARVLLKVAISFLTALLTANFAFQAVSAIDLTSTLGIVWMTAQLFLFFLLVAISYLISGSRSRWTSITVALLAAVISGGGLVSLLSPEVGVLLSLGVGVLVFLLFFKFAGLATAHLKDMPGHVMSPNYDTTLFKQNENSDWEIRKLERTTLFRKKSTISYMIWNEKRAYLLHPVELDQKFGMASNRRGGARISYKGRSINTWLLLLVSKQLPLWRTRNSPMVLVLLDVKNANGKRAETIGVALPDSIRRLPVGIFPAKGIDSGALRGMFGKIDTAYKSFNRELTPRQRTALADLGAATESEYLETELVEVEA